MGDSFKKAIFSFKTKFIDTKLENLHRETAANLEIENLSGLNLKKRQALISYALIHSDFYKKKISEIGILNSRFITRRGFLKTTPINPN